MEYRAEDIKKSKSGPNLPHSWGIQSTVEMLRAHGPTVTRGQYIRALACASEKAKLEVERRTILRRTKNRVFIKMEDL